MRLVTGWGVQVPLTFGPCEVEDLKPRMLRAVESLGAEDVRTLLAEQGEAQPLLPRGWLREREGKRERDERVAVVCRPCGGAVRVLCGGGAV